MADNNVQAEEEAVNDEPCDEGEIDHNDYRESECELDPEDEIGAAEIIELSSDDEGKPKKSGKRVIDKVKRNADGVPMDQMNFKPWTDSKNWTDDVRAIVELDFCKRMNAPINGSWQQTEDYQRELVCLSPYYFRCASTESLLNPHSGQ